MELHGPLTSARFARLLAQRWTAVGRAVADAAKQADLLLLSAMGWLGYHVGEAYGVPGMGVFRQPLEPTQAFPVHHAGAGITAAALRAGTPSVCVPFTADQPFWADRVARPHAGPAPIRFSHLTAEALADALDGGYRAGAEAVAGKLRTEDGIGRAVAAIRGRLG